jgi:hypothetical protein
MFRQKKKRVDLIFETSCTSNLASGKGQCILSIYLTFPTNTYQDTQRIKYNFVNLTLLSRSRLCHYSVGGAWWHLGFYESF